MRDVMDDVVGQEVFETESLRRNSDAIIEKMSLVVKELMQDGRMEIYDEEGREVTSMVADKDGYLSCVLWHSMEMGKGVLGDPYADLMGAIRFDINSVQDSEGHEIVSYPPVIVEKSVSPLMQEVDQKEAEEGGEGSGGGSSVVREGIATSAVLMFLYDTLLKLCPLGANEQPQLEIGALQQQFTDAITNGQVPMLAAAKPKTLGPS